MTPEPDAHRDRLTEVAGRLEGVTEQSVVVAVEELAAVHRLLAEELAGSA